MSEMQHVRNSGKFTNLPLYSLGVKVFLRQILILWHYFCLWKAHLFFLFLRWFSHLVPIVATSAKERYCSLDDQIRHPAVVKEMTHIFTPWELSPTGSFSSIKECFNDIQTRLWMMVVLRVIEITPVPCAVAFHGTHSTCHGIKNKGWEGGNLLR